MNTLFIETPEGLEWLPDGSVINDDGLIATKVRGAWLYSHDGQFWEPEHFPVRVVEIPS